MESKAPEASAGSVSGRLTGRRWCSPVMKGLGGHQTFQHDQDVVQAFSGVMTWVGEKGVQTELDRRCGSVPRGLCLTSCALHRATYLVGMNSVNQSKPPTTWLALCLVSAGSQRNHPLPVTSLHGDAPGPPRHVLGIRSFRSRSKPFPLLLAHPYSLTPVQHSGSSLLSLPP